MSIITKRTKVFQEAWLWPSHMTCSMGECHCGAVPSKGKRRTLSVRIECLVMCFFFHSFIVFLSLYHVHMRESLCSVSSQET